MAENQLGDRALDGQGSQKKEKEGADKSRQKHFFLLR
jgi:hypothetical protein